MSKTHDAMRYQRSFSWLRVAISTWQSAVLVLSPTTEKEGKKKHPKTQPKQKPKKPPNQSNDNKTVSKGTDRVRYCC